MWPSHPMALPFITIATLAGEGCWVPYPTGTCEMRRARDPVGASSAPLPQDPASSSSRATAPPGAQTSGISTPDPLATGKKHLSVYTHIHRSGRRDSPSSHFPSWLNCDDSSHLQIIYFTDVPRRLPGQPGCVCPSRGQHVLPAGCAVVGMGAGVLGGGGVRGWGCVVWRLPCGLP